MALAKCARCGKLFMRVRSPVCLKCEPDEEADYEKARNSLQELPNQTPEQLSEATGVGVECILRLLADGRIAAVPDVRVICGRCGAPAISLSKKLCERCLQKLTAELAASQARIKFPDKKDIELGTAMNLRKSMEEEKKE